MRYFLVIIPPDSKADGSKLSAFKRHAAFCEGVWIVGADDSAEPAEQALGDHLELGKEEGWYGLVAPVNISAITGFGKVNFVDQLMDWRQLDA
ncbi:MAG: hypothetical protein OYL92_03605 [Acidobacteriota bacterium]|nr:hypothetical protein [Acidobacteriota bacterium]MDE3264035.1 hypothetical protein [Acidobacteriota bacterium]